MLRMGEPCLVVVFTLGVRCSALALSESGRANRDPRALGIARDVDVDDEEDARKVVLGEADIEDQDFDKSGYQTSVRDIGRIKVVTVETRAGNPMKIAGRASGRENESTLAENMGVGEPWHYYRTKNGLMLQWLNATMEVDPNTIAIMIDASDMIFGGCNEAFIMKKYRETLKASGGGRSMTMVASAETACYPAGMAWKFRDNVSFESRREAVNKAVENLTQNWVEQYAACTDWRVAPCDKAPAYRYLNWGWVMGPVKDLQRLFTYVYHDGRRHELDQQRAMQYMYDHPEELTLDYSASMVFSIHQLAHGRPDSSAPIELRNDTRGIPYIHNKVTNKMCCFAHGNGDGEGFVNKMIKSMGMEST